MLTKSQIKYIQTLKEKKFRDEHAVFVAEGPKILNELLASHHLQPVAIYAVESWWKENGDIRNEIPFVSFYEISPSELDRISFLSTPHQVVAIFQKPAFKESFIPDDAVTILLDGIQDPGNLGTIIRIADWFGVKHIVAEIDSADAFSPKVIQATMGSIARVNISYENIETIIRTHDTVTTYAAALDGKPVHTIGKINRAMLLIGNESKGIRPELLSLVREKITIPRFGEAESLNAAVATGIILSHLL